MKRTTATKGNPIAEDLMLRNQELERELKLSENTIISLVDIICDLLKGIQTGDQDRMERGIGAAKHMLSGIECAE